MAGPSIRMNFQGLDKLIRKLEGRPGAVAKATLSAITMEGEEVVTGAKLRTPVDTGALRSSGHVRPPQVTDSGVVVEVGFGGPAGSGNRGGTNPEDVGYAVHVHENMSARHVVGQAKYLETVVNERRATFASRLAGRIADALKRVS